MNQYSKGSNVRMKGIITEVETGYLVDPTELFLHVRSPNETVVTYNYNGGAGLINRQSSGTYYMDYVPDDEGIWFYHYFASGTGASASQSRFEILPPGA